MTEINLLPESFRIKPSTIKNAQLLKKISYILFLLLTLVVSVSLGLFIMYRSRINEASERKNQLENQIKALQETEQKLILVKDRLKKTKNIYELPSAKEEIDGIRNILEEFDNNIFVTNIEMSASKTSLHVRTSNSIDVIEFLEFIKTKGDYKNAVLENMNYKPDSGFNISLTLVRKT